jgi:hypothetical protein
MTALKGDRPVKPTLIFSGRNVLRQSSLLLLITGLWVGTARAEVDETTVPIEPSVEQSDPWQFTAAAYLWGASMKGETRAGDDLDVGFDDILDKLKFGGMGSLGVRKGRWVVFGDLIYLKLTDELKTGPASADVDLQAWVTQASAGYTVKKTEDYALDVFAGARYLRLDVDVSTSLGPLPLPLDLDRAEGTWNGIAGIKGNIKLPKQWFANYYLDAGTGEAKLTYQLMGGVGYKFEKVSAIAGYRYIKWKFDRDDKLGRIFKELILQGPYAGVLFRF